MKKILLITLISVYIIILGCTNNTEDLLSAPDNGEENPDPIEEISYADKVQPIFNTSCGGGGCHTNGGNANGVNLSSYAQTMNSTGSSYGGKVVIAGNADTSPIVDKIEPSPTHGSRMPLGGSPLSSSQIQTIRTWINEGALNN